MTVLQDVSVLATGQQMGKTIQDNVSRLTGDMEP